MESRNLALVFNLHDDQGALLETYEMELEEEKGYCASMSHTYGGLNFEMTAKDGLAYCNGQRLFSGTSEDDQGNPIQDVVKVTPKDAPEGTPVYTMTVKVRPQTLPKRVHPEGRVCGDCALFSSELGKEVLKEITHRYQDNLTMCMSKEIVNHMSTQHKCPALEEKDAGYCPKRQELCSLQSPACDEMIPRESVKYERLEGK